MVEGAMRRIVENTAAANGCTAEIEYNYLEPSVRNDDLALNETARESIRTLFGEEALVETERATGSEDFSYIMEHIPSSLFVFIGCYDEATGSVHAVHNEKFRINEEILPRGAAGYAQFAADYLRKAAGGENA